MCMVPNNAYDLIPVSEIEREGGVGGGGGVCEQIFLSELGLHSFAY